jgi:ADP-heptose:LPS heptosyltransferase
MDLVITVDTALAHLAGAMGIPALVLLPFQPDFRWLVERDDTPWYPTLRLYRQPIPGNWGTVIRQVLRDLKG